MPDAFHGFNDICPGIAHRIDGNRGLALVADTGGGFLVIKADCGNVADQNPAQPVGAQICLAAQHNAVDRLQRVQLALRADNVAPLAFFHISGGDRDVLRAQFRDHLRNGQAKPRQPLRIDDHAQFARDAAKHIDVGKTFNPLQLILDDIFNEVAIFDDRAGVALGPCQNEPGNRAVFRAGGIEPRLPGFIGIGVDPVEPVGDQQQGAVHIGADGKFQGDFSASALRARQHGLQTIQPAQHIFLRIDDFALNLGRCSAAPIGRHQDDWFAHIRCQLDRDGAECDQTE